MARAHNIHEINFLYVTEVVCHISSSSHMEIQDVGSSLVLNFARKVALESPDPLDLLGLGLACGENVACETSGWSG